MRILIAIPLALLPIASASGAPGGGPASPAPPRGEIRLAAPDRCDSNRARLAEGAGTLRARRLIDLPPGNLDLAVMREMGGCPEPVTVAENFGSVEGPRAARAPARTPVRPRARLLRR